MRGSEAKLAAMFVGDQVNSETKSMTALRIVRFDCCSMPGVCRASRVFVFAEAVDASCIQKSIDQFVYVIRVGEN